MTEKKHCGEPRSESIGPQPDIYTECDIYTPDSVWSTFLQFTKWDHEIDIEPLRKE